MDFARQLDFSALPEATDAEKENFRADLQRKQEEFMRERVKHRQRE